MFMVITQLFSFVGGMIGLFLIDYRLAFVVLLFVPVKYAIAKFFAGRREKSMDAYIAENRKYAGWFGDALGGIREIKLFNIFEHKHNEFRERQANVISEKKRMNIINEYNSATETVMLQLLVAAIYILGANMVFSFKLSVGSVFAFITYSAYVTTPISAILNIRYFLSGIIPSTKRHYDFMQLEEEDDDGHDGLKPEYGTLELCDVSFSYDSEQMVLKEVNAKFEKGSKTALVGKNGSGKSTLINLILRVITPDAGEILLSDTNIACLPLNTYRSAISLVSQTIYLFNDTIRNNICLYKNISEKTLAQALKDSTIDKYVDEVSLDYIVGQNGSMLSGGQKQKIAMARALVHDSPIVILDEATSSADVYSESQINALLKTSLKDKTVIIVTHKPDMLPDMDIVAFFWNGGVQMGKYEDLCKGNEHFREMMTMAQKL